LFNYLTAIRTATLNFFGIPFFLTRYLHEITLSILLGLLVFPEGIATAA
jgi:hypothetical protein